MNKTIAYSFVGLLLVSLGAAYFFKPDLIRNSPSDKKDSVAENANVSPNDNPANNSTQNSAKALLSGNTAPINGSIATLGSPKNTANPNEPIQSEVGAPLTTKEKESIHQMAGVLFKFALTKTNPKALIKELQDAGLKPVLGQDRNEFTGAMVTVRTQEALPGTRYSHAQFFQDGNKEPILQHYSYEQKPGPDSYPTAVKELTAYAEQYAKKDYKLTKISEDMTQIELPNCYVAHAKKMDAEDLRNNLINAHDLKTDVGTVRVAIELNPHCHGDTDSHLGH